MLPIVYKDQSPMTYFLTERSFIYSLIEMFVPHKISFFLFHWRTHTTRITLNFNRANVF